MSKWRQIKTAPKDGTFVDLWVIGKVKRKQKLFHPERLTDCIYGEQIKKWIWVNCEEYAQISLDKLNVIPTHWMPIPEGPKQ